MNSYAMNDESDSIKELVLKDLKPSVITLGDELNLSVILNENDDDEVADIKYNLPVCDTSKNEAKGQDKNLTCSVCQKTFPSKRYLNRHFSKHTSQYQCSLCGKVLCRKETLLRHLPRCKENKFSDYSCPRIPTNSRKDPNKYSCETCSKTFTRRENYDQHIMTHYGMQVVCYVCDKVLRSFKSYRRHIKSHLQTVKPSLQCALCPAEFSQKSNLRRHEMHQHSDKIICEKCNHWVKNKNLLQKHRENETITCAICSELFCLKTELKAHVKLIHNNLWFFCKHCSGRTPFMTKFEYNLRNHVRKLHNIILESDDCYKDRWFALLDD